MSDRMRVLVRICDHEAHAPDFESLKALAEEMVRARTKFPKSRFMVTAILEELGELAKGILQREPVERLREEALQVACTAMRFYEEGDPVYDDLTDDEAKL